ncbi:hypothetical protein GCM10022384_54780 [Streptomyces marokkonensis]|uniref:Uncharacterized protein n=1 Tax=Streptomyces marokkonensis TaxID=324855 RepID=A0ABP7RQJ7_9ACTN
MEGEPGQYLAALRAEVAPQAQHIADGDDDRDDREAGQHPLHGTSPPSGRTWDGMAGGGDMWGMQQTLRGRARVRQCDL